MIIFHDICRAFEEPHTSIDVVFPYRFPTKPIELSRHLLTVRVHAFEKRVLVNELRSRETYRNHPDMMMASTIEFSDEFFFPCC